MDDAELASNEPPDPYTLLNLSHSALPHEIQQAYKQASRSLHPDKHPPSDRENARDVFTTFKNAYDILNDDVLRQAYDEFGHDGVNHLRKCLNSHDSEKLELASNLNRLHSKGAASDRKRAKELLRSSLLSEEYLMFLEGAPTSGRIELRCTTLNTRLFREGLETPWKLPDMEQGLLDINVRIPRGCGKWSGGFGGSAMLEKRVGAKGVDQEGIGRKGIGKKGVGENGVGSFNSHLSLGYEPVTGIDITGNLDFGDSSKMTLSSTRVMSSGTVLTSTIATIPHAENLSLSLASQRMLFQNKLYGTFAMGIASNGTFHFAKLSLQNTSSTNVKNIPRVNLTLNIGMDHTPLKLTVLQNITKFHNISCQCCLGITGLQFRALSTRVLTKFTSLSIGVKHHAFTGLTWILELQQADISFSLPIHIASLGPLPYYAPKLAYLCLVSSIIDAVIGDIFQAGKKNFIAIETSESSSSNHSRQAFNQNQALLLKWQKKEQDAKEQKQLMQPTADAKRKQEDDINGLVILKAMYGSQYPQNNEHAIDVTTPLQFWVINSQLSLPGSTKSHMLGFYDVLGKVNEINSSCDSPSLWNTLWQMKGLGTSSHKNQLGSFLNVRYKMGGSVFEVTVADEDPLKLPAPNALRLGDTNVS